MMSLYHHGKWTVKVHAETQEKMGQASFWYTENLE